MHLQILTAQALADNSGSSGQQRSRLPSADQGSKAPLGVLENGVQNLELRLVPGVQDAAQQQPAELVVIHPYECSECSLIFQTPEDYLQHQGEHFLGQDKESGESGVMSGFEEARGRDESADRMDAIRAKVAEKKVAFCAKSHQCNLCHRTFTSINRLAAHTRVHEQGTYECPDCGKMFKKATSLQTHMRTHSGVARYLCVDCGSGFTTEMTLILHRKTHTPDPFHKCVFCNKTFTNMTKYLYHRRPHLNRDSAGAPAPVSMVPDASFHPKGMRSRLQGEPPPPLSPSSRRPEKRRLPSAASSKTACGPPSRRKRWRKWGRTRRRAPPARGADLAGAPAAAASDRPAFSCGLCSRTFLTQLQLVHHRHKSHGPERKFVCGLCGKSFKKRIHVRNHIRTHTGERPFQCSECGKTFSSLANLMRHNLIHSGVRPYRCDVCHRCFSQASNLRQHALLHAKAEALCCPDCPATFRWASKLAAHRYTKHPGAPAPFSCPHCEAGFLTRTERDAHCLQLHSAPAQAGTGDEAGKDPETEPPSDKDPGSELSAASESWNSVGNVRGSQDCAICGKKLNSAANLRLHRLSHCALGPGRPRCTPAKRPKAHQCPTCGKQFVSSSGVALHQRVHTGERPFPCQV
ncbi:unnamed protein product, partial [Tetraodon nigroviridis]